MQTPLISVIVPVYKAEPYLEKCIDSIRNQTYQNLEIILVDDGSPDRCGAMCDAYAKEDSRIRVFHKVNEGQSSARNLGLDHMTGEYVGFVDSDDWIEADMYEHLYGLMQEYGAQIACCGIQNDFCDGRVTYYNSEYAQNKRIYAYSTMEALQESLRNEKITYSPCDKLYHKNIFSNLRMTVGRIYEDMEIIPKCIERAEVVVYDSRPMYHYFMTEESTIRGEFNVHRFAEADVAWEKAADYRVRYPHLYDLAMMQYIAICLRIIHLSAGVAACVERRKDLITQMRTEVSQIAVRNLPQKTKIKLMVFRISPMAYEIMMRIYDKIKG